MQERKGKTSVVKSGSNHSNQAGWCARLLETFGTRSKRFTEHQISRISSALTDHDGNIDANAVEGIAAVLDGAQPGNEIEAMLLIQMATTHTLVMNMTGRAYRVGGETTLQQLDLLSVALARLHRTFAMQVDTLAQACGAAAGKESPLNIFTSTPAGRPSSAT